MGAVRTIVFDFDGVIVDSMPVHERAWLEAIRQTLGRAQRELENRIVRNLYAGHAGPRMFEGVQVDSETRDALRAAKDAEWRSRRSDVHLFAGAGTVLRALAVRHRLAIASTAHRADVEAVLRDERLDGCIARVITDRDVSAPKPSPTMLLQVIAELGGTVHATCMIGDTSTDRAMSEAASVRFLLFRPDRDGAADLPGSGERVRSWDEIATTLDVDPPAA